jgi:hypothetical protein
MECHAIWLKNAPAKFQRVMDDTLKPYFDWLIVYIDDILSILFLSGSTFQASKEYFCKLLNKAGLVLSKKKIELFQTQVKFLGHTIKNGPDYFTNSCC